MKIAVVSDTHGRNSEVIKSILVNKDLEMIIHLGDMVEDARKIEQATGLKTIVVRGNNDYTEISTPWKEVLDLEGHRILITHGHHERVNWGMQTLYFTAKEENVEMVMYGHTHVYHNEVYEGIRILNPGSAGYDRAFEYESYCILDISKEEIKIERIKL